MKVLLVNPKIFHKIKTNIPDIIEQSGVLYPPLGLLYIAAFLKKKSRHQVSVIDMEAQSISISDFRNIIKTDMPGVVGLYTTTFNIVDTLLLIRIVKEINPDIHVCLGGYHANIYFGETISLDGVDSVILGEGEITFTNLVDALEKNKKLSDIKGLVYKESGKIIKTGQADSISNLDILSFPDRKMLPLERYYSAASHIFPTTAMITSRGCPYKCIFCYNSHLGKNVRFRSSGNVISEIEECLALGIKDIFFYDDTFILDRKRIYDICNGIIERKLKFSWSIRTRVNNIDIAILAKLKKAGCRRIQFGVEAGAPKVILMLNKGISISQVKEAFRLTKKAGIETFAYFMIGSPAEGLKEILETVDFAIKLSPDYAHFAVTLPLPATELYEMGLNRNVFKNDFWREFAKNPTINFSPKLWEEFLSEEELLKLLRYAYRHFYFRPGYILSTMLLKVTSLKDLSKRLKLGVDLFKYIFLG